MDIMVDTTLRAAPPVSRGPIPLQDRPIQDETGRGAGRRRAIKQMFLGVGLLAGLAAAADYGYRYWNVGQYLVSTDDAYVQADYTVVAPKVSGYIAQVLVADNQQVEAGQILARIDDRDFLTALDQARAEADAADATIRELRAQIILQRSLVEQQQADIAASAAALRFARQENVRFQTLAQDGFGTGERAEQTSASLSEEQAQLRGNQAGLLAAERKIDVLTAQLSEAVAGREHSLAVVRQAELNLSYTTITAPVTGTVGARALRVGEYVQAGTALMAVVPLNAAYVVANYKETQLANVFPGQKATIEVDGMDGATVTGRVDSIAPASGLEFALLPPDNATGNFTKIVQRIPVKIVLDDPAVAARLRAGMSVEPSIDTKP